MVRADGHGGLRTGRLDIRRDTPPVAFSGPGGVIKTVSARWPDARGRFSLVLPASARGKTIRFWQSTLQAFSTFPARPGGPVDLRTWPTALSPPVPRDVLAVRVPS